MWWALSGCQFPGLFISCDPTEKQCSQKLDFGDLGSLRSTSPSSSKGTDTRKQSAESSLTWLVSVQTLNEMHHQSLIAVRPCPLLWASGPDELLPVTRLKGCMDVTCTYSCKYTRVIDWLVQFYIHFQICVFHSRLQRINPAPIIIWKTE